MRKIDIELEEIVRLKEEGMSDREIAERFTKQGINVSRSTIRKILAKYYESIGKTKPNAKIIEIPIEDIVKLNKEGMTEKQIVEYFKSKGIRVGMSTINLKLKKYYESIHTQKPKARSKPRIDIEELVYLKEQGLSDEEVARELNRQGRVIASNTVSKRLISYYKAKGIKKPNQTPNGRVKRNRRKKINISIEKIAQLKEQGMSYVKIAKYLREEEGINVSLSNIYRRLGEYYKSVGKKTQKDIEIEDILKLKEKGMSAAKIVKYFKEEKGIMVCEETIRKRLTEYYKSIGEERLQERKILPMDEIIMLRQKGLSVKKIVQYLKQKDINVSESTIYKRLKEDYKVNEEESDSTTKTRIGRPSEKYDDDVKYILMNGMTIDEYIDETGKKHKRKSLEIKLRKLKFLAGYSEERDRTMGL